MTSVRVDRWWLVRILRRQQVMVAIADRHEPQPIAGEAGRGLRTALDSLAPGDRGCQQSANEKVMCS